MCDPLSEVQASHILVDQINQLRDLFGGISKLDIFMKSISQGE